MKILHVLDHSLPLHSGYAFRSQAIFQAQLKRGWQPVALTSPKHEENWKGPWKPEETINGIRYYRTGVASLKGLPVVKDLDLMRILSRRIKEVLKLEKPDLLHAHSPILNGLPAFRVGHKCSIPVVYEIRAFWEDAAVDHGTYGKDSWKYKLVKSLETRLCRKVDHVAVLCSGLKEDLVKRGISSEKLTEVFNGVSIEDFHSSEPDEEYRQAWGLVGKKVIGFIGSFYHYEGWIFLLKPSPASADHGLM